MLNVEIRGQRQPLSLFRSHYLLRWSMGSPAATLGRLWSCFAAFSPATSLGVVVGSASRTASPTTPLGGGCGERFAGCPSRYSASGSPWGTLPRAAPHSHSLGDLLASALTRSPA